MIAANVQAARFLARHRLPTLFRVHSGPPDDKFEELRLLFQALGVAVPDQAQSRARHLNRVLNAVRSRPDFQMLATALLRSLSQAVYQPANIGHFGLALGSYAHFTSPIRRYPDLLVHRAIHHVVARKGAADYPLDRERMEQLAERCSHRARRAEEAERDVNERLKAIFMERHIGDVFKGQVTGVTSFGLFVELERNHVSGLVHITSLPNDYYHFDPVVHRLRGDRSGRVYQLAQKVSVRVMAVNVEERKIDFELAT